MKIEITNHHGKTLAEITSDKIIISEVQDALDIMADCSYQGADRIIIHEKNLSPAFFDLKTKLAGEILQKFSNYRTYLAIVGDYSEYTGKSLRDFIYESNKAGRIVFVNSYEEARSRLS
ncbi:MAG: DUF4180 domain-containing protein [Bacteroidales bacterium]|nr:DUF4180 domain-containing protein [Bacteroidales bacterium]